MADIDFIGQYVPATVELSSTVVQDCNNRLRDYLDEAFPEVANGPGTALGDLVVNPQTYMLAAVEEGVSRVESDLRLENVAKGTVYNCDFVQAYLKNFGVDTSLEHPSSGTVRLTFSEDKDYVLDRSVQFRLQGRVYSMYLPNNGPFTCYSTVSVMPAGVNGSRLKDTGSGMWFCDVPVVGNVGSVDIPAATTAEVSITPPVPELAAAVALHAFTSGSEAASLQELAQKAQETIYSATLNTRNGAVRYVKSVCPFAESVFAVKNGDRELLRDLHNPLGVSAGCLDVYARTHAYEFTEQQVVKLVLNETPDADGKTWFEGYWDYVGQPYHLESVTHDNLALAQLPHKILSINARDLGALAAYTQAEKLYLKVENLMNGEDSAYETFKEAGNDETYAYFRVTYQTDPLLPALAQTVENEDYRPINSDILVRGFIPVIIEEFAVVYVRKPGVVPDLAYASDEIKKYLAGVGVPHSYTDAEISRIMGEAGAQYTKRILVQARVQWTLADKVLKYGEAVDMDNPGDESIMQDVPASPVIRDSDGLRIVYPNKAVPLTYSMMYSCSPRNIRYFLLENALRFKEVRDV